MKYRKSNYSKKNQNESAKQAVTHFYKLKHTGCNVISTSKISISCQNFVKIVYLPVFQCNNKQNCMTICLCLSLFCAFQNKKHIYCTLPYIVAKIKHYIS